MVPRPPPPRRGSPKPRQRQNSRLRPLVHPQPRNQRLPHRQAHPSPTSTRPTRSRARRAYSWPARASHVRTSHARTRQARARQTRTRLTRARHTCSGHTRCPCSGQSGGPRHARSSRSIIGQARAGADTTGERCPRHAPIWGERSRCSSAWDERSRRGRSTRTRRWTRHRKVPRGGTAALPPPVRTRCTGHRRPAGGRLRRSARSAEPHVEHSASKAVIVRRGPACPRNRVHIEDGAGPVVRGPTSRALACAKVRRRREGLGQVEHRARPIVTRRPRLRRPRTWQGRRNPVKRSARASALGGRRARKPSTSRTATQRGRRSMPRRRRAPAPP